MRDAVRCSLFAVRCSLFAVRCSLFAVRCSLFAVRERLWTRFCVCQAVLYVFRRFIITAANAIQSFHAVLYHDGYVSARDRQIVCPSNCSAASFSKKKSTRFAVGQNVQRTDGKLNPMDKVFPSATPPRPTTISADCSNGAQRAQAL